MMNEPAIPHPYLAVTGVFCVVLGVYMHAYIDPIVWPVVGAELGLGSAYSLAIQITTLFSGIFTPVAAKLSYLWPKRNLLMLAAAVYALVCLGQILLKSLFMLLVLRGLMGLCNAVIFTVGLILIGDIFPPERRGLWVGAYGALLGLASVSAPLIGGAILDHASWRWCFLLPPPCMAAGLLLLWRGLPPLAGTAQRGRFDLAGAVLLTSALAGLLLLLSLGGEQVPWNSPTAFLLAAMALVGGGLAVRHEKRMGSDAVVPVAIFRQKNVTAVILGAFFSASSATVVYYTLAFYMTAALGASATEAGIAVGIQFVLTLVCGPVFGRALGRSGRLRPIMIGSGLIMIAVYLYLIFGLRPSASFVGLYLAMFVFGVYALAISVIYPFAAQNYVPPSARGYASGGVHLGQSLAYAVTLALVTLCLDGVGDLHAGFRLVCLLSMGLTAAAVWMTLRLKQN